MRLIDADRLLKKDRLYYSYLADEFYVRKSDIEDAPTVDAMPWMWLEAFAKTKPFDSVDEFIAEAKEMNRKIYSHCCADVERRE